MGQSPTPPDPYVQIIGLEASRSLGDGRLAAFANSKDERVSVRALLAIGRTRLQAGVPLLEPHLKDSSAAQRAMAVYGLGLIGQRASASDILAAFQDNSDAVLIAAEDATDRFESAHLLSRAQEESAFHALIRLLNFGGSPALRGRAAQALNGFTNGALTYFAANYLAERFGGERDPYVRWHIMWSIFRGYAIQVPRATLVRGLHDSDETVRIEAVRALGRVKNKDAIALLQPMTRDASWRVQEQALESIKILSGGAQTEHLKVIPPGVRVPEKVADPLDALPALPREAVSIKPRRPNAEEVITAPPLVVDSIATMTGPQPGPHPRMRIVTTQGNIYVELYPEWAPITARNFLSLSQRGYYDNNPWFRIVPDFVVQTGDPTGNGEGDAGYTIPAEENPIEQDSYIISMGLNYDDNGPVRDSAGTQFYITLSPQLHLDRDFTVFGRVIGGTGVLGRLIESDKIIRVERISDSQ